jgi:probable phosphoglycerate mutase
VLLVGSACATARLRPEQPPTLRVYLARHGQTDWNAIRRLQGQSDTELNATGREQAEQLRDRMQALALDHVYSSTLRRSRETAEIAHGTVPLTSLPGLMEQHVGKFEGQVIDDKHPEAREEFTRRSHDPEDTLDGGESENQFVARVRAAVETIRAQSPAGSILIVGHGGTNRAILRALLDLTAEQAAAIQQANDELYLIELVPGAKPRLWKWIDSSHLSEL